MVMTMGSLMYWSGFVSEKNFSTYVQAYLHATGFSAASGRQRRRCSPLLGAAGRAIWCRGAMSLPGLSGLSSVGGLPTCALGLQRGYSAFDACTELAGAALADCQWLAARHGADEA